MSVGEAGELTAEIRWWWRGGVPASVIGYFKAGPQYPVDERTDLYLRTGDVGLGIKQRTTGDGECADEGFEVKSLVAQLEQPVPGGRVELWSKHVVQAGKLPRGALLKVRKKRQMRYFRVAKGRASETRDAHESDCQLEMVDVRAGRGTGISLCFEARASIADPAANLLAALELLGPPPGRDEALIASYPAWLTRLARI
jgi:hypothetical protein